MTNPYTPTTLHLDQPSATPPLQGSRAAILWFVPGCVLGLNLGSVVEQGFRATIQRTARDPLSALQFFVILGTVCLMMSFLWRLPRRYLIGSHRIRWIGAFFGGAVFVGGGYVSFIGLESLLVLDSSREPTKAEWSIIAIVVAMFVIISVEAEAGFARLTFSRNNDQSSELDTVASDESAG